jgi:hypothetical protein
MDLRHFLWTDKINIRWKHVTYNLQVDAATACVEASGKYFEKNLNLQFVTHSNLNQLSSAVLNYSVGYMLFVVKYDLTSLPPEFDEGCGLKAEQ